MRIWISCSTGLGLSMLFGWSYGFLAVIMPMFMLNAMNDFNFKGLLLILFAVFFSTLTATYIVDLFQFKPVLMLLAVGIMMSVFCIAMMFPQTYIFGFVGILVSSIVLMLASYDATDIEDFNINTWVIAVSSVIISTLSYWIFPNTADDAAASPPPPKSNTDKISHAAMGWIIAMLSFVVFQIMELSDSLAALVSIVIILAPMNLEGSKGMGKIRILGTALGCLAGLMIQLLLGEWYAYGWLFWLAFIIPLGYFSRMFSRGAIQSGIAFSAISALSVPLTTSLIPEQQDAFFAILYRFSSIFFVVVMTTMVMWVVHHIVSGPLRKRVLVEVT
ncbi:DUF2955 domain-containing protein [Endozoicomonadaceae bacterium StTr2]